MSPRGQLDKLQEAIAKRLASASDLALADIYTDASKPLERQFSKASGVKITVEVPMPISASKYAAGPVFSKVAISVLVERNETSAIHSPSLAGLCECVTKLLHNWTAPLESCYGKIAISAENPWRVREVKAQNTAAISVNFIAQSVLN